MTGEEPRPAVRLAFERDFRVIPIEALTPLKPLRPGVKESKKYAQILASVRAIGIVEPPAVVPDKRNPGRFLLLDGHLRIEALKDLGVAEAECLISTDDEAYNYNKRINRLSPTQEHRMIARAAERGVSEERLAEALGLEVSSIRRRFRLLDGICLAASEMLRDSPAPMAAFELLRRMSPARQVEAAQLMLDQNNFSLNFAKAMLAATPDRDLVDPRRRKPSKRKQSAEQMARLERELASLQVQAKSYEDGFAIDNLHLQLSKGYVVKLLSQARIARWLRQHHPDYLEQFQAITEFRSLSSDAHP